MVEQLAKQHSHLEHEARLTLDANKMAAAHSSKKDGPAATGGSVSSDDEFEDATDDVAGQFSVACPANHKRTRSDLSQMSEGRGGVMLTESESSQDEDTSNMIEVITHKRGSRTSLSTRCKETGSSDRLSGNFTPSAATATDAASASSSTSSAGAAVVGIGDSTAGRARRQRRTVIPDKPNYPLSLWSIMKNCIGKELSKIPVPVNFSEPLSMLQRLTEDFEYSELLDRAAACTDSCEQLCLVAAFTVSSYATTAYRSSKPFNPLLGETYECDRRDDLGWRVISEQVSHHPPMLAQFCEGRGWECYQEFTMSSKFRGKYLQIIPMGVAHLHFHSSGNHYTWRKVTTSVHNIIVGRLWVDQHGDMEIVNHKTGDKCNLKYVPYSYFSRDVLRRVTGCVSDSAGTVRWVLMGTWDAQMECCRVLEPSGAVKQSGSSKPVIETAAPRVIWRVNKLPENADRVYNFTRLAVQLNEPEPGVCPTDCRLRPDQRLMETGDWDSANNEKLRLEEKQRSVRKLREQQAEQAAAEGAEFRGHQPCWFVRQLDQYTNQLVYMYTRQYWTCKEQQEWSRCPDIF